MMINFIRCIFGVILLKCHPILVGENPFLFPQLQPTVAVGVFHSEIFHIEYECALSFMHLYECAYVDVDECST